MSASVERLQTLVGMIADIRRELESEQRAHARLVLDPAPSMRALACAITKLDEARMWTVEAAGFLVER